MSVNGLKWDALATLTGATPPITLNELEWLWLSTETGETGPVDGLWHTYWDNAAIPAGPWNDRANAWLTGLGYAGTLDEKWYQLWEAGGPAGDPDLVFHAFDGDPFDPDIIVGTGSITEASTSTRYYPDDNGVWQAFGSGEVGVTYRAGEWWVIPQRQATNSQTYSATQTNAVYTKTNTLAAKTSTGMRGDANGACSVVADASGGTIMASAITAGNTFYHGFRLFLKRQIGTGTIEVTLDNGSTWQDVTAELAAGTGFVEIVREQQVTNPQCGIRITTSGDSVIIGNWETHLDVRNSGLNIRGGSPIFTTTTAGTISHHGMTCSLDNHSNTRGAWYMEVMPLFNEVEVGSGDYFVITFDGTDADSTPCNMANGEYFSAQFLDPMAAGGASTSQLSQPMAAGTKHKVGVAYELALNDCTQNLDGNWDAGAGVDDFGGWELGTEISFWQAISNFWRGNALIRNVRRYDLGYSDARDKVEELMA